MSSLKGVEKISLEYNGGVFTWDRDEVDKADKADFIEYSQADIRSAQILYRQMRKPLPKPTRRQRRYIGRAIRKRLRIEREMCDFFVEVMGVKPLSWQLDVLVSMKMANFSPTALFIYGGKGIGRSSLQKVVDEYMRKHRIHQKKLEITARYRTYDEQLAAYNRYNGRHVADAVDAMTYSLVEQGNRYHNQAESIIDLEKHTKKHDADFCEIDWAAPR